MSVRKIFSIIGLVLSVLLLVCLFIPFFDFGSYGGTYSLWEYFHELKTGGTAILVIIELLIAITAFILQLTGVTKDAKLAYLGLGYFFTYHLSTFISAIGNSAFDQLSFGFWLGLILSTIAVIIVFIGSLVSNESKPKYGYANQPVGFDPKTGKPIYDEPKAVIGYDPNTGSPIYK